jgi:hypothetical protein
MCCSSCKPLVAHRPARPALLLLLLLLRLRLPGRNAASGSYRIIAVRC